MPFDLKDIGYVYLIHGDYGLTKIGKTNDPAERIKALRKQYTFSMEYILLMAFPRKDAFAAENFFHKMFAKKRVEGEWFNLSKRDIKKINTIWTETKEITHNSLPDDEREYLEYLQNELCNLEIYNIIR